MFNNIAGTIKTLAKIVFWFATILCLIFGIASWVTEEKEFIMGIYPIIVSLGLTIGGSFLIYGFGQLIENTDIIAQQSERQNIKHEKYVQKKKDAADKAKNDKAKSQIFDDSVGEEEFVDFVCSGCKEVISYKKKYVISEEYIECPYCSEKIKTSK